MTFTRRFLLIVDTLSRARPNRAFLSELHALGIDLFLHQQGLDTTNAGR
jgi:hypothetical protein